MINYINLKKQYIKERKSLLSVIDKTLSTGMYILDKEVDLFEKNIQKYNKSKYCVALNSGTDALTLALYLVGVRKNDEVITTSNSFVASTAVIAHLGAKPIFSDVLPDQNIDPQDIKKKITKKTKAIMPVHLTGRPCEMDEIIYLSKKFGIPIIEDAAQAIGTKYKKKNVGNFGEIGCFSAHPLKNLNALGDSGYLVCNDRKYYEKAKELRNHGLISRSNVKNFGHVSRMDAIQASILNFRLRKLNKLILRRRDNFKFYNNFLDKEKVFFPPEKKYQFNTYHTFVIQTKNRNKLKKYLMKKGIETSIHYPKPIHMQTAYKKLKIKPVNLVNTIQQSKKILTLPINQYLSQSDIRYICSTINNY